MQGAALFSSLLSPIAAVGNYLLDTTTTAIAGAYSTRRLRTAYTGPSVRIARSSGGQTDIGFTSGGDFDSAAMAAFDTGNNTMTVLKWYDQSGNGQDIVNTNTDSTVPVAKYAGSNMVISGKQAIQFYNPQKRFLTNSAFLTSSQALSMFMVTTVGTNNQTGGNVTVAAFKDPAASNYYDNAGSEWMIDYAPAQTQNVTSYLSGYLSGIQVTPTSDTVVHQIASVFTGTSHLMTVDGTAGSAVSYSGAIVSSGALYICSSPTGDAAFDGLVGEMIIAKGPIASGDQVKIRTSQRSYYGTM